MKNRMMLNPVEEMETIWRSIKAKDYPTAEAHLRRYPNKQGYHWAIASAHLLEAQGDFQGALKIYEQCRDPHSALFTSQAFCLEKMGELHEALKIHSDAVKVFILTNDQERHFAYAKNLYYLGRCYEKINQPQDALIHYYQAQQFASAEFNLKVSISIAYCLSKLNRFEEANHLFESLCKDSSQMVSDYLLFLQKTLQHSKLQQVLKELNREDISFAHKFELAIAYKNMGDYKNAIRNLKIIMNGDEDLKVNAHIEAAYCYGKLGDNQQAEFLYKEAVSYSKDELKVFINFTNFLFHFGKMHQAEIVLFEALQIHPENPQLIAQLGKCAEYNGDYIHAQQRYDDAYGKTNDQDIHIDILIKKSSCFMEMGELPKAKEQIEAALNPSSNNLTAILQYVRILLKISEFDLAYAYIQKAIRISPENKKILLSLCEYYTEIQDYVLAQQSYEYLLQLHPNYTSAQVQYGYFLLNTHKEDAIQFKEFLLNANHTELKLCLLQIRFYQRAKDVGKAYHLLLKAKDKFYDSPSVYVSLVHHHLSLNQLEEVAETIRECEKLFPYNRKLLHLLEKLRHLPKHLINYYYEKINPVDVLQIQLSPKLNKIFQEEFSDFSPDQTYICGSSLMNELIEQYAHNDLKRVDSKDYDFIFLSDDPETVLIAKNFRNSIYNPNLYSKKTEEGTIDVYVLKTGNDALHEDLIKRDTSVSTLICDKHGRIYDVLDGRALIDLKYKRLKILGDPATRIHEDPVRALRAIKFMCLGFNPDEQLVKALKSLKRDENFEIHAGHFYAKTRKYVMQFSDEYIKYLEKFGILNNIFNISFGNHTKIAYQTLLNRLDRQPNFIPNDLAPIDALPQQKKNKSELKVPESNKATRIAHHRNALFNTKISEDCQKLKACFSQINLAFQKLTYPDLKDLTYEAACLEANIYFKQQLQKPLDEFYALRNLKPLDTDTQFRSLYNKYVGKLQEFIKNENVKIAKLYSTLNKDEAQRKAIANYELLFAMLEKKNEMRAYLHLIPITIKQIKGDTLLNTNPFQRLVLLDRYIKKLHEVCILTAIPDTDIVAKLKDNTSVSIFAEELFYYATNYIAQHVCSAHAHMIRASCSMQLTILSSGIFKILASEVEDDLYFAEFHINCMSDDNEKKILSGVLDTGKEIAKNLYDHYNPNNMSITVYDLGPRR